MLARALSRVLTVARSFARDTRGNAALIMVSGIAMFMGLAGAGFDFAMFNAQKQALQRAADAGALAATRELALLTPSRSGVKQTAEAFALQEISAALPLDSIAVKTTILEHGKGVEVIVTGDTKPLMTFFALDKTTHLQARAQANLVGGTPLCALALAPLLPSAISMTSDAKIVAEECAVYSNSRSALGVVALNNAELTSALTCTAGGYGGLAANFSPEPTTDCPRIEDPLSGRAEPAVGACNYLAKVVLLGSTVTLNPGVYCGGLTVGVGAKVTLNPGTYIMKNGPLLVAADATMKGQNVGFFFKGVLSVMVFEPTSHVDLTAPKAGPMAGFLFFGDRASPTRLFVIHSNDARNLLGTIYLPHGILMVDASRPVADRSAYTVIVAERLIVQDGPTLVLNADYNGTDVPVPKGVGPREATPALTR